MWNKVKGAVESALGVDLDGDGLTGADSLAKDEWLDDMGWDRYRARCNDVVENCERAPSPNHAGLFKTPPSAVVFHFTAGPNTQGTLDWFANPASGVSAHYVIGRDGQIFRCISESLRANHAGRSKWTDPNGKKHMWFNRFAIGIEMANLGRCETRPKGKVLTSYGKELDASDYYGWMDDPDESGVVWERYAPAQMDSAQRLFQDLVLRLPIKWVVGHSEISGYRGKIDPGPAFDWRRFREDGSFEPHPALDPIGVA